jgi:hypothetical protein
MEELIKGAITTLMRRKNRIYIEIPGWNAM